MLSQSNSKTTYLRLGFHYHIPMFRDTNGNLRTPGYLGRFLDGLAEYCEILICFLHSPPSDEIPHMDYEIQAQNLIWVDLGVHTSVPRRALFARQYTANLRRWRKDLDIMLIRGPSPLLPAVASAVYPLPIALLLVGDQNTGINDLPQPRWRKEAIRLFWLWNTYRQLTVAKRSLVIVNSRKLYEQFLPYTKNLVETRTTTLSENDFFGRTDTCQQNPIHLLYTGRIDRAKGLFELLQAVEILIGNRLDVVLDLVGWPAKGDTIVDELKADAQKRNIETRVRFHGYKAIGPELFTYYKQADIYVLASQSEGFPRTIWEAMAHSIPVIATKVGSIPHFLTDNENVLLIEPNSSIHIADAVQTLVGNSTIRQHLIARARQLAHENTLEYRSAELYHYLHKWMIANEQTHAPVSS